MSEFKIDFEWPVAAKYDFRPATAEEISAWRARPQSLREMSEAEWPLCLGRIVPGGKVTVHRPKIDELQDAVRLLVGYENLPFHKLVLKATRVLGTIVPPPDGDSLLNWYDLACELRLMFQGKRVVLGKEYTWPHPEAQFTSGYLRIYLVPGKDKEPTLALRPDDLEAALRLCATQMIATGTAFNICKNCKIPFLSGGGSSRNKKRGDARFCSDACRYKFHNESRRKAR
jgi:hypothetical protein